MAAMIGSRTRWIFSKRPAISSCAMNMRGVAPCEARHQASERMGRQVLVALGALHVGARAPGRAFALDHDDAGGRVGGEVVDDRRAVR